ncbi:hypothetical protein FOL47_004337 [Perkinsus chesapeaki]|uniref:Uncharacterized protein n=1 Tax=Perkinsus chesapeaki TaxID=330153 RepID=A0A7J6M3B2_PERCH|nr:hypothetical protein FOL47_004337 [Perkinsus chesapeaki]
MGCSSSKAATSPAPFPSASGPGTLRSISPESRSAIEVMGWSSNPKWIAPKKTELTADIANLGIDGDTSAVLDSKGKPIMLMLKYVGQQAKLYKYLVRFGENAQILDCTTGLLLLSTTHRGDDNVVLTTPENEKLANIVEHRSVLGKTKAECSITGLVFVADSNSSIVISHPSRGDVARVHWDKNNYDGHHFVIEPGVDMLTIVGCILGGVLQFDTWGSRSTLTFRRKTPASVNSGSNWNEKI